MTASEVLSKHAVELKKQALHIGCPCGAGTLVVAHHYHEKPKGEVAFKFAVKSAYERYLFQCPQCKHYLNVHSMLASNDNIYDHDYVTATYGDVEGLKSNFLRITSLPEGKSDNRERVARVNKWAQSHDTSKSLLDVGSGLAVFVYEMKKLGWNCTALDTDPRLTQHAKVVAGVETICADFFKTSELLTYDMISFNKVLEHVTYPLTFLQKAARHLSPRGSIYIEVPDASGAEKEGFEREEFFIEHIHVFTPKSLEKLIEAAHLKLLDLQSIKEPSGKFTLFAFVER